MHFCCKSSKIWEPQFVLDSSSKEEDASFALGRFAITNLYHLLCNRVRILFLISPEFVSDFQQIFVLLFQLGRKMLWLCVLTKTCSNPQHCKWETLTVLSASRDTAGRNHCCAIWDLSVARSPISSVHIVTGDSNTNTISCPILFLLTGRKWSRHNLLRVSVLIPALSWLKARDFVLKCTFYTLCDIRDFLCGISFKK